MTRITGLATGLDVDAVVEETMNAYQTKIDAVDQQKKLAEIQQELYREVITECRDFYDKYFDISKSDSILLQKNWVSTVFESSSSAVTVTGSSTAELGNYSVEVTQLAKAATYTLSTSDTVGVIYINNVEVDLTGVSDEKKKVEIINTALKDIGVSAKYSEFSKGIVLTSDKLGSDQVISVSKEKPITTELSSDYFATIIDEYEKNGKGSMDEFIFEIGGAKITVDCSDGISEEKIKDAMKKIGIDIDDSNTDKYIITQPHVSSIVKNGTDCIATISKGDEKYEIVGSTSNSITLDGVTFKFNSITSDEVNITGKTDITKVKDNIVKFVNDYNSLMEKLNTLINEKRDSNYMPLTDAQKEEMTEKQIELWEKKVKTGQLNRDSDLTRIRNTMKTAMSSLTNSLSSFGIKPVSDYGGNKNGTFTIDEDALTKALENNTEDVMKVFISNEENNKGVAQQLKTLFDKETQSSSGSLLKKAGMEGSSTASNNTLSKKIAKYEEKISRMESLFATKQQALYSKYARLETLMNNLNSQSSYLMSMFSS